MKTKILRINNVDIRYTDEGDGITVVLLHGYLESLEIWNSFAKRLSDFYRIICPDIPGHGLSGIAGSIHTMESMAFFIKELLMRLSIDKCILVGHSMGGYISLAFADKYPDYLKGLVLFHSAPFADTKEKKVNRDREIELIRQRKKELLVNTNIPKSFANDNLIRLSTSVEMAKQIAGNNPDKGIIALLEGMKQRPDRSTVIKQCPVPFLWILGRKDNYIFFEQIQKRIQLGEQGQKMVLENSGHMGFVEEPEISLEALRKFIGQCE